MPTTSAGLPRVSFFFSFLFLLLWPLTVIMKQTRQAVHAIKQSIILDVYVLYTHVSEANSFTRKSDFALMQVYFTNNIFLFSKMNQLNVKMLLEIGRVNIP